MTRAESARAMLDSWHKMMAAGDLTGVAVLCAPDAVSRSLLSHTPYRAAELLARFCSRAAQTFADFRYHRSLSEASAMSCWS